MRRSPPNRSSRCATVAASVGYSSCASSRAIAAASSGRASRISTTTGVDYDAVLGEVLTAVVTPFDSDGAVDHDRFRELAQFLLDNGSDGLVVAATTGESPTLTDDERLELLRVAVDAVGGRGTVIAGTGTYSTAHSIHLTREAHEIGVGGFLVVTPYYNKPPPRGIVAHFQAIAAESERQ